MNARDHWNAIYANKSDAELSWFEPLPSISLQLLEQSGLNDDTCVLDVGGGNSRLVDYLVERGLRCVAVLDISRQALDAATARLGSTADLVTSIEAGRPLLT